jgi:hypothetical protein
MIARPIIDTFHSPTAPTLVSWVGRFRDGKGGYLPLAFHAPTQELAERLLTDWWDAEQRRIQARALRTERARAARRGKAAA